MTTTTPDRYDRAIALASKLDAKVEKIQGYASETLREWLQTLINKGRVEVGYRSSCGTTDTTMKIFREWLKVVKALRASGVVVGEEPVKHKNAWATKACGFWSSIIYSIEVAK